MPRGDTLWSKDGAQRKTMMIIWATEPNKKCTDHPKIIAIVLGSSFLSQSFEMCKCTKQQQQTDFSKSAVFKEKKQIIALAAPQPS